MSLRSAVDLLVPLPKKIELHAGAFPLDGPIALGRLESFRSPALRHLRDELELRRCRLHEGEGKRRLELVLEPSAHPAEGYELRVEPRRIRVSAATTVGLAHGLSTLTQLVRVAPLGPDFPLGAIPALAIEDAPTFERRGVMLDVSRDRVPRMDFLYLLVDRLSEWKCNELQLYLEHAFAYREHETVWRGADPFTPDEIRALDAFCAERGIELVPNQQSFGHLHHWLKHEPYRRLAEVPAGIVHPFLPAGVTAPEPFSLCPTDPESLAFLGRLYDELLPCFHSRDFNVGLDETIDLGPGRSAAACRSRGIGRVYLDFLREVHGLVSARGRRMQFWADILLNHPELVREVPGDALACLWGYEADHPFEAQTKTLADAGLPFYVCPGTSSWQSIGGRTDNMAANIHSAALWGAARGARGLLVTDWGDRGHLQPPSVSWAGYLTAADLAWNPAAAARNHGSEPYTLLAQLLATHVFRDETKQLGQAAVSLGHVSRAVGLRRPNASVLSLLLTRCEAPVPSSELAGLTHEGLEEARQHAVWSENQAGSGGSGASDGSLAQSELRWAARLLQFACQLGNARLEALDGRPLAALKPFDRQRLVDCLRPLIEEHRELWPRRSRPGGLERSAAWLERPLAALQTR